MNLFRVGASMVGGTENLAQSEGDFVCRKEKISEGSIVVWRVRVHHLRLKASFSNMAAAAFVEALTPPPLLLLSLVR